MMLETNGLLIERKLSKPAIKSWHVQARHLAKHICPSGQRGENEGKVCGRAYAISSSQIKKHQHLKYYGDKSKPCIKGTKGCPFPK
jgi:hypothetical protein